MVAQKSPNQSPRRAHLSLLMAGRNQVQAKAAEPLPTKPFPAVCLASTRLAAVVMEEVAQAVAAAPSAADGPPSLVLPHSVPPSPDAPAPAPLPVSPPWPLVPAMTSARSGVWPGRWRAARQAMPPAALWRSRLRSHPMWGLAAAGLAIVVVVIVVVLLQQGGGSATGRSPANASVPPQPVAVIETPAPLEEPPAAPAVAVAETADSAVAVAEPPTDTPLSPVVGEADDSTPPAAPLPSRPAEDGAEEPAAAAVPSADAGAAVTVSALRAPLETWPETVVWVVREGEILTDIAQRHQTVMLAIVALNGLADPSAIAAGQRLLIPQGFLPTAGVDGSAPGWLDHLLTWRDLRIRVVSEGESLRHIANEDVTTVEALQVLNALAALDAEAFLLPGRLLLIPFGFNERPQVSASVN